LPRCLVVLAFKSRVLWVVVIVKQRESNYSGTLFFLITNEPIPRLKSVISSILINRGSSPFEGSLTQLILNSSSLKNTLLCTNLFVLLHIFRKMSPLISSLLSSKAYPMFDTAKSFNLP